MARNWQEIEANLRESEEKFRQLAETVTEVFWIYDLRQHRMMYLSPAYENIWGQPRAPVYADPGAWLQAVHPDDRERVGQGFRRSSEAAFDQEYRLVRPDGAIRWIWGRTFMIRDEQGRATRLVGIAQDITERKQADEALAGTNTRLLTTVQELAEAKQAAEAATRAKSDFLATMSHEIRTPMNGVLGMLGLLLDTPLSARQRDVAETARNSADNLLTVIDDILDFSRIEAGKMVIEAAPFNLRQVVEDVAILLSFRARDKDVEILVRYAPDVPRHVAGDPGRIRQVLTNLTGNAVKFTDQGHVLIDVQAEAAADSQAIFRFTIIDTGIGIPADKQDNLFDMFSQADTSTTRKYGGTGLGLAISKRLTELMGGSIGFSSQAGAGSRFWFALPLSVPRAPSDAQLAMRDLAGVRVLIVDDNEVNRRILEEQIGTWGLRADVCASGEMALACLRQAQQAGDPYQVALLDYQMPAMDGVELARKIKADAALADIVLIILSSLGPRMDVTQVQEMGLAWLTKPVRASQLMDALHAGWARRTQGAWPSPAVDWEECAWQPRWPRPPRVLLVDDNVVNQKVARLMLEQLGCRVDIASHGQEAIRMIEMMMTPYDLILMDVEMPVMDGLDATRAIRTQSQLPHTPIIAMTAKVMLGDRERCLEAGMDDYLGKPVKPEKLAAILQRWLPAVEPTSAEGKPSLSARISLGTPVAIDAATVASLRSTAAVTDPSLFGQIVQAFVGDTTARLTALRQAIERGDAAEVHAVAHALKGASASVGANRMADLSRTLEESGAAGLLAGADRTLAQLEQEFALARGELEAALSS